MATIQGRRHTEYVLRLRCKFPPGVTPIATSTRPVRFTAQGHNVAAPLPRGWHAWIAVLRMTAQEIRDQQLPTDLPLTINGQVSRVELVWT